MYYLNLCNFVINMYCLVLFERPTIIEQPLHFQCILRCKSLSVFYTYVITFIEICLFDKDGYYKNNKLIYLLLRHVNGRASSHQGNITTCPWSH